MLKSFLYAVLKVYIYIRSDWYEPVTFFVYIENRISYYTKSSVRIAEVRSRIMSQASAFTSVIAGGASLAFSNALSARMCLGTFFALVIGDVGSILTQIKGVNLSRNK